MLSDVQVGGMRDEGAIALFIIILAPRAPRALDD